MNERNGGPSLDQVARLERDGVLARGSGQPDGAPARPRIGADGPAADQGVPAHVPDRGLAAGVLKQDVGAAVGSDGVPTRPGIGADRSTAL
jgi:hypothetical protein